MSDINLGDFDRFFAKQEGAVVGHRTKPSQREQQNKDETAFKATLKDWVAQMDEKGKWDEFDTKVKDFAQRFEVPYTKAMIYLLFNVF